MNLDKISSITYDLIIAKADVDYETNPDKREHVEKLEKKLIELLK